MDHPFGPFIRRSHDPSFWLYNEYMTGATDLPTYKISIAFDGQKKEVLDYMGRAVGMPEEVTRLEAMIDRIAGTKKWLTLDAIPPEASSPPPEPALIIPKVPKTKLPKLNVEEQDGRK